MSLLHHTKTAPDPVTEGRYPPIHTTPLVAPRAKDDAYPGVLRTLAMFLFAR